MTNDRFARERPDGQIEIVDEHTGAIVEVRPSFETAYKSRRSKALTNRLSYSPFLADIICQRIANGTPVSKVCDAPGFPSLATISRWTFQYPEFKAKFKQARRALAMRAADQIFDVAGIDPTGERQPEFIDKDDVPGKKLQFDALKWVAEKSDSEFYTTKHVQHHGDAESPIRFIIDTGIRREPEIVEAECKDMTDDDTTRKSSEVGEFEHSLHQRRDESDGA